MVIIAGPTAVGKTTLAIEIAKEFNTEIISADSRQIYQELNIGVARPSSEELTSITHHFIAHKSIHDYYSAADYEQDAFLLLNKLYQHYDIVVCCGGTGFYINALLYGFDKMPIVDMRVRQLIIDTYAEKGLEYLQQELKQLDNVTYQTIDINNKQRVMRALEVCYATDKPFSSFKQQQIASRMFIPIKIGLNLPKEKLHSQINKRVETMISNGLLDEVKQLIKYKTANALQTVGYKELFEYLEGTINFADAVNLIQLHTRQYAKRQLTFFNKHHDYSWFLPDETNKIITHIKEKTQQV